MLPRSGGVGRLLAAAEDPLHASRRVELDHHVRPLVDRPDVVVSVDADAVRERPAVQLFADLADELTLRPELEQLCRGGAIRRPVRTVRSREDEDMPFRVDGDARHFPEVHPFRKLQEIGDGIERDRRRGSHLHRGLLLFRAAATTSARLGQQQSRQR